jgi:hypothetical protein
MFMTDSNQGFGLASAKAIVATGVGQGLRAAIERQAEQGVIRSCHE